MKPDNDPRPESLGAFLLKLTIAAAKALLLVGILAAVWLFTQR